jgi:hypothetical protein
VTLNLNKELRTNPVFNPFHPSYNYELIYKDIEQLTKIAEDLPIEIQQELTACIVSYYYNLLYNGTYNYLKEQIQKSNLSTEQILHFTLITINRNYYLINNQIDEQNSNQAENHILDTFRHKIQPYDKSIAPIEAGAAMESDIDNLNLILSYLRFFEGETVNDHKNDVPEIESVSRVRNFSLVGSLLTGNKLCYEDSLWNRGYIEFDSESKKIVIDYHSHDELKLLKVGHIRLLQNSMANYFSAINIFKDSTPSSPFKEFKNIKRIKKIEFKDGYITYELAKGVDKVEAYLEYKLLMELETYYPFMQSKKFPNYPDLNIDDIVVLFSSLQLLFKKTMSSFKVENDEVKTIKEFYKFPFRIKKSDLISYLRIKTKFSEKQINSFLRFLVSPFSSKSRIDLWSYPLIEYKGDYLIAFLSLVSPITLHLIDKWLNQGGYSLSERGLLFEEFLKTELKKDFDKKKYFSQIPSKSMYKIPGKGEEEIDLIINLKTKIVVAEVKCIKYPLSIRDYHNAYKILINASQQVIRKAQFVKDNQDFFTKEIGNMQDKEIVRIIITNYPNFSGYILNDIPVVDAFLVESYILSGKLSQRKLIMKKNQMKQMEEYNEIKYYDNETEMSDRLSSFMLNPVPIEAIKSKIKIQLTKKTLEKSDFEIYVQEPFLDESLRGN